MESVDYKPLIRIPIPGPIISLDLLTLTIFYSAIAYFDYYLYCRTSIPYQKYKHWQRLFHISIPFIVGSKVHGVSTLFISWPWFIASVGSYTSLLYKEKQAKAEKQSPPQSFTEWIESVGIEGLAQSQDRQANGNPTIKKEIRIEGLKRVITCTLTIALGHFLLNPFLLDDPTDLLTFPWYTPRCMYHGFLIGLKGYTLFLSNDMTLGFVQSVTGVRMMHAFNKTIMATSLKDFWGNRWNMVVVMIFRKQICAEKNAPREADSVMALKRLRAFFISAIMHEMIMTIVNKEVTLEQFGFFMINGLGVYLQTRVPKAISEKVPIWLSRLLTFIFLSCTSKLFVAPFMRFEEQKDLFGKHSPM